MKNIYLKFIPSFIAFTLVGCTGAVTLKDEAGNKITFKREDVSCTEGADSGRNGSGLYFNCAANGVVEDLAGYKSAERYEGWVCYTADKESETNIACVAGVNFGLY